jgi:hypothetical protein
MKRRGAYKPSQLPRTKEKPRPRLPLELTAESPTRVRAVNSAGSRQRAHHEMQYFFPPPYGLRWRNTFGLGYPAGLNL